MAIRLNSSLVAAVLGLSLAYARPVAAADLWTASQNTVSNNIEIDKFDGRGLLTGGFYLHNDLGDIGPGYFSGFAFDPAGTLWTASQNTVSNNIEIDKFDGRGLLTGGFYLHNDLGDIGPGYFSGFAFDPAGTLWTASQNTVSNNIEIDKFDGRGLLTGGFYLHNDLGDIGPGYFSGFAFDPAGTLWTASQNTVSNNIEIDKFDGRGLLTGGFYLHNDLGDIGPGYFSGFAFDPAGNLWTASQNTVSNNIEIDKFDSNGLLTGGFYLHNVFGDIGPGYFSGFAFDPAVAAAAPEPTSWAMMIIGFGFLAAISWREAGLRRRKARYRERGGTTNGAAQRTEVQGSLAPPHPAASPNRPRSDRGRAAQHLAPS